MALEDALQKQVRDGEGICVTCRGSSKTSLDVFPPNFLQLEST